MARTSIFEVRGSSLFKMPIMAGDQIIWMEGRASEPQRQKAEAGWPSPRNCSFLSTFSKRFGSSLTRIKIGQGSETPTGGQGS